MSYSILHTSDYMCQVPLIKLQKLSYLHWTKLSAQRVFLVVEVVLYEISAMLIIVVTIATLL